MVNVTKKLGQLRNKRVIASWIAVVATLLLSAEILWTVEEIWPNLEAWAKAGIVMATFAVVVIFGWRRSPSQKAGGVL